MEWSDSLPMDLWALTIALLPLPDRTRVRQTCRHLQVVVDRTCSTDSMVPTDTSPSVTYVRPRGPILHGNLGAGIEGKRSRSRSIRELWRLEGPWQHYLAASGHHDALSWVLHGTGADVDEVVPSPCLGAAGQWAGRTALMVAVLAEDLRAVGVLLKVTTPTRRRRCDWCSGR